MPRRYFLRPYLLATLAFSTTLFSCAPPLDTTRTIPTRMTLGAEIFKVLCQHLAAQAFPNDDTGAQSIAMCIGQAAPDQSTPPRLAALVNERARLVAALDNALPDQNNFHDELSTFLVNIVPLYDKPDETMPNQTRATAALLASFLSDSDSMDVLARMAQRRGYHERRFSLGAVRPLLSYPGFDQLTGLFLKAIDRGGAAGPQWEALTQALALNMASATPSTDPPTVPRTIDFVHDLLLEEDDLFSQTSPAWVVKRDKRGIAYPAQNSGVYVAPFVDTDNDGLADTDSLGRFVDAAGTVLTVPTPFPIHGETGVSRDTSGRALDGSGALLYQYIDASRTMIAGIVGELAKQLDPADPKGLDLVWGATPLLGARVARTEQFGSTSMTYQGFDEPNSPLFDLVHAATTVLPHEEVLNALEVSNQLMTNYEPALAPVIDTMWFGNTQSDMYPNAALVQPNDFWDHLIAVAQTISNSPGLLEGLLRATADPATNDLGAIMALFLRHTDEVTFDPSNLNGPPIPSTLTQPVDWTSPDSYALPDTADDWSEVDSSYSQLMTSTNASLFQRSIAAIHDINGVRLCNKEGAKLLLAAGISWPLVGSYHECELFQIDNVAEFYAQSVVGTASLILKDSSLRSILHTLNNTLGLSTGRVLEVQSGITGFTSDPNDSTIVHPTPQAVARMAFAKPNDFMLHLINPPLTVDGLPAWKLYASTIPAWETPFWVGDHQASFLDALRPMLQAFMQYDDAGGHFLFAEFIAAVHEHWSAPGSTFTQNTDTTHPLFSFQSNARSYEPLLADIFGDGNLMGRLGTLTNAMTQINVGGVDGVANMANLAELLLTTESFCGGDCGVGAGPAYRDGTQSYCSNTGFCETTWPLCTSCAPSNAGTLSVYNYDVNTGYCYCQYDPTGRRQRNVPPIYLLLDALKHMDQVFAANPDRSAKWKPARSALVHQLFDVDSSGGTYELTNRRGRAITLDLLPFLHDRVQAHFTQGDETAWAHGLEARLTDTLDCAVGGSTVDFVEAIRTDADAQNAMVQLLHYLMDSSSSYDALATLSAGGTDALQILPDDADEVPLVKTLSAAIAPNAKDAVAGTAALDTTNSPLNRTLTVVRAMRAQDQHMTLATLLFNLVQPTVGNEFETPLDVITDVIGQVNRTTPGSPDAMSREDLQECFQNAHDFMLDTSHGVERLYQVVQSRNLQ